MLVIVCILAVFLSAAVGLYLFIGRNRYGNRRTTNLQLTASEAALQNRSLNPETVRRIRIYFIKPSRYDDDGYVSIFRFGVLPNNTLTVLAALNSTLNQRYAAAQRNVYLETVIWDEICDGVISPETVKAIKDKAREDGVELLIGMAGVQSNQYPRGRDLALQFVAEGMTVMMGGFHVSGYPDSVTFLNSCGITAIVGEAENLWSDIVEGAEVWHSRDTAERLRGRSDLCPKLGQIAHGSAAGRSHAIAGLAQASFGGTQGTR